MEENSGRRHLMPHLSAGINTLDLAENGGRNLKQAAIVVSFSLLSPVEWLFWVVAFCASPAARNDSHCRHREADDPPIPVDSGCGEMGPIRLRGRRTASPDNDATGGTRTQHSLLVDSDRTTCADNWPIIIRRSLLLPSFSARMAAHHQSSPSPTVCACCSSQVEEGNKGIVLPVWSRRL